MYEFQTTFRTDFAIADSFGHEATKDTAARAFEEWKDNIIYLTELIMVINHRCWDWYHVGDVEMSALYSDLYYEYYEKAVDYLEEKGNKEDMSYFFRTLD